MGLYFKQTFKDIKKQAIVLHHTSGSFDPYAVIDWWAHASNNISVSKVIGGISTMPKTNDFDPNKYDGLVVECFDPKYWAYHLGLKGEPGYIVSKQSIGIEICNYGFLIKDSNGRFINYVHGVVPESQVVKLKKPFRNYEYWQDYTDKQIESLRLELLKLSSDFNIDLHAGIYALLKKGQRSFDLQSSAISGKGGLWSHTSFRRDKTDVYPNEKIIEMILSL